MPVSASVAAPISSGRARSRETRREATSANHTSMVEHRANLQGIVSNGGAAISWACLAEHGSDARRPREFSLVEAEAAEEFPDNPLWMGFQDAEVQDHLVLLEDWHLQT
eukprot:CAMPEP_0172775360 /NCGR_PEP_ID=MMETSP1074-20121228/197808_1 /TAXON_ID=2916 /ORGANISM="Ceratium fusus, Strain PA161109" /LENGTH=108 /DNA_ID=CAMNT_0013611953 /DNA_START=1 /DNA_END=328 /DNA_ORIENTATION=+